MTKRFNKQGNFGKKYFKNKIDISDDHELDEELITSLVDLKNKKLSKNDLKWIEIIEMKILREEMISIKLRNVLRDIKNKYI